MGKVYVVGTCDTKEAELRYAKGLIEAQGVAAVLVDVGTRGAGSAPDVSAAEVARRSGRPVAYRDLPGGEFRAALLRAGLPEALEGLLADSDAAASRGALFDDGRALSALIGRPTTPMPVTVGEALGASVRAAA